MPDSAAKTTYTTWERSFIFNVKVSPCVPLTLTATNKVTDIYYSIGDPDVFSSPYLYTLAPSCNLTPTLTVTKLPTLATHNIVATNFKVSLTTDLALIGSYVVTMTSSLTFMKDYLKNLNTLTTSYTYSMSMTPCVIT